MEHIPPGRLGATQAVSIIVNTYFETLKSMLKETYDDNAQQTFTFKLPYGRYLTISHQTYQLPKKEWYWLWEIHCSKDEYDNGKFKYTEGVIDWYNTERCKDRFSDEVLKHQLFWAIHIAITVFE